MYILDRSLLVSHTFSWVLGTHLDEPSALKHTTYSRRVRLTTSE